MNHCGIEQPKNQSNINLEGGSELGSAILLGSQHNTSRDRQAHGTLGGGEWKAKKHLVQKSGSRESKGRTEMEA